MHNAFREKTVKENLYRYSDLRSLLKDLQVMKLGKLFNKEIKYGFYIFYDETVKTLDHAKIFQPVEFLVIDFEKAGNFVKQNWKDIVNSNMFRFNDKKKWALDDYWGSSFICIKPRQLKEAVIWQMSQQSN
jgi:hypothetical protein